MRLCPLVLLCGCGGSFYGDVPLGWRGTIPTCDDAEVDSGDAVTKLGTGFFSADHEGRASLRCKGGGTTSVGVKRAVRLAIEGERELPVDSSLGYWLRAYDAKGNELRFADPTLDIIDWTTSWPEPDASIERAYCHEPLFACPDSSFAKLFVRKTGTVTVRATFAGLTAQLDVVVK